MACRLFSRPVDAEVTALLVPHSPGLPSQFQGAALERLGFVPLFDVARGEQLERLGAVLAKTRCDGALWPMERAARKDGLARWGFKSDVELLDTLLRALTAGGQDFVGVVKDAAALHSAVDMIMKRLKNLDVLDEDTLLALDSTVRLGTTRQVMAFLESL